MTTCTILTNTGWKYRGPHTFGSPQKAIEHLRKVFNDQEIKFDSDPNDEDAASVEIRTKLCGNSALVATLIDGKV